MNTECVSNLYDTFPNLYCVTLSRQTENSHVKTNLVHTLYRVKKYGVMDIDKFQELLTPEELKSCQQYNRKSWYSIPLEVFTSFIFKVCAVLLSNHYRLYLVVSVFHMKLSLL